MTDGETALLTWPRDVGALGRALERLAGDGARCARLGGRGREIFEQRFSAEAFTRALGGAYAELGFHPVGGAGAPPA